MSKKPISYSAYEKYHQCPKKYDLYYNQRLKSEYLSNALLFGSATDKALNCILEGGSDEQAIAAAQQDLTRLFTEKVQIEPSDFDSEIITQESNQLMVTKLQENGWKGNNPDVLWSTLCDKISFGTVLSENETKAMNILVFFTWLEKISLIITAWREYVEPQIEEVVSVQTKIKRGILDFQLKLKGIDGIITADNKTAGKEYSPDAVRVSVQLASYQAEKACYIVFVKTVRKNRTKTCSVCGFDGSGRQHKSCFNEVDGERCGGAWDETISPEIIPQIIIDDITPETRELVETSFVETEKAIDAGHFPRNLKACGNQFGKPCEYINLCWNNDMKGLVKREPSGRSDK